MNQIAMSRRTLLKQSGVALTSWALLNTLRVGTTPAVLAQNGVEVLPWLDQPAENPVPHCTRLGRAGCVDHPDGELL